MAAAQRHSGCDQPLHMTISAPHPMLRAAAFILLVFTPAVANAATILVRAGENLQTAINAAQPGDTLLLEAGATFSGNFVLPVKTGDTYITIRSAGADAQLPGPGTRIAPSHAPLLAKIRSSNTMAALRTAPGAHHWRLLLLEFPATREGYGEILQIGDGSSAQTELSQVPFEIELDRLYIHGDPVMGQKRGVALNARSVTIRNCYISDIRGVGMDTQAIGGWNGPGPFLIENNYLEAAGENLLLGGADPAIANLVSEDVVIRNNYMSRPMSWRDPVVPTPQGITAQAQAGGSLTAGVHSYRIVARKRVSGGVVARSAASTEVSADVGSGGSVLLSWTPVPDSSEYYVYGRSPAGTSQVWTVTSATFTDSGTAGRSGAAPTSAGNIWTVKNILELKNARRVLIEQNVFENNWAGGQSGYAIVFTPRNQDRACTWCVVEDVTFQNNVVRNSSGGINILGYDDLAPSQQTRRIRIVGNLFARLTTTLGGNGWFLLMGNGPSEITVDHNTIDANGNTISYFYGGVSGGTLPIAQSLFTNNAARHGSYGMNGADASFGLGVIAAFLPDGQVRGNWLQGGYAPRYPAGNFFDGTFESAFQNVAAGDYTAAPGGPLAGRATDGTNIGADMSTIATVLTNVIAGTMRRGPTPPTNLRVIKK